jgi:asparagine synthase (glutamine-hydrolysing)
MESRDGDYVVVFNGEIYNHQDIRSQLARDGWSYGWRGHSDTETVIAGFQHWGIDETLRRSAGMFALAAWSRRRSTLTLARDRFGEKPLFFSWVRGPDGEGLLFGSELKALRRHPSFSVVIDRAAVAGYCRFGAVPGESSVYAGTRKLPPASVAEVSLSNPGKLALRRYWNFDSFVLSERGRCVGRPIPEIVDELDQTLREVISDQMVADVPLGAFLSGGVDSSTVVALMQQISPRPVRTFSIGFGEQEFDESRYAAAVASHLGTEHEGLQVSDSIAREVIPALPDLYDEPFADSSAIPTLLVSRLAKASVTVALSGDAGDEVFGGYNRYQLTQSAWARIRSIPSPVRQMLGATIRAVPPRIIDAIARQTPLSRRWTAIGYKAHKAASVLASRNELDLYLGLRAWWTDPVVPGEEFPDAGLDRHFFASSALTPVEKMMATDMVSYLPDDILTKVDRAAMSVSLETRIPFLDHRLVSFAWGLPTDLKVRFESGRWVTKWVLRQVLYRYVPKQLIERPKMGFGIPLAEWLRGPLRDWAESLLDEAALRDQGIFDSRIVSTKWREHLDGRGDWEHQLWAILMFQAWYNREHQRAG